MKKLLLMFATLILTGCMLETKYEDGETIMWKDIACKLILAREIQSRWGGHIFKYNLNLNCSMHVRDIHSHDVAGYCKLLDIPAIIPPAPYTDDTQTFGRRNFHDQLQLHILPLLEPRGIDGFEYYNDYETDEMDIKPESPDTLCWIISSPSQVEFLGKIK